MKFIIYRSSDLRKDLRNPNIEGAIEAEIHVIDICWKEEDLPRFKTTHTDIKNIGKGRYEGARVTPNKAWVIEIGSMDELLALADKTEMGISIYRKGTIPSMFPNKEGYREIEVTDDEF